MDYSVFISHSTRDRRVVEALANQLEECGIEVVIANEYLSPGEPLDEKILRLIEKANCMIVLLTKGGARSSWVQQEIGVALNARKPLIPIVEKGVDSSDLGALQGREYISYDHLKPQQALAEASIYVNNLKLEKKQKELEEFIIGVSALALGVLLLVGGKKG